MNQNQMMTYHSNLVYDRHGRLREMFSTLGRKEGLAIVRSQSQVNLFRQWWNNQKDGVMIRCDYTVIKPHKTTQQVKTHWGLLINTVIAKANEEGMDTSGFLKLMIRDDVPTGVGLTSDFIHELMYALCPCYDEKGKRITLSKMTIDQASKWFEDCRNLLASRGIYIPDPDPNWKETIEAK